jgi:deoxyribodipyrimidine photo-lyase
MHNRLRMVVAMFLSKNLLIDWRWGERWFMQHLVDGDFAANNGGWQWSASTGTDAVPYFRLFNPVRQSERFDTRGDFIKSYIPALQNETEKSIHDPAKLDTDYFEAMVDLKFSRDRCLAAFKEYKS